MAAPAILILLLCVVTSSARQHTQKNSCPALNEHGVKYFDIGLPNLTVPQRQTFYVCQQFKIPEELLDKTYHAVAFTPLIDNEDVMHHMILFACTNGTQASEPHNCGSQEATCRSYLTVWSLGFDSDTCLYTKAGVSIGKGGHQVLSLQIHWNNDGKDANTTDSTGIRIHYTEKLRKYELGNVQIGQEDIELPPGSVRKVIAGSCSPYCISEQFTSPLYLTRTFIHMHSLGVAGRMDQYRNGSHIRNIAYAQTYSYKRPPTHYHPRAIKILPGDEIKLTCWFSTVGGERKRNRTIYWGEGIEGEMCYAFVSYFPKTAGFDQCVQYAGYDQCDNYNRKTSIMGKCDFRMFLSEMGGEIGTVIQFCDEKSTLDCDSRCAQSIRSIYSHACMQGRLAIYLQQRVVPTANWSRIEEIHNKLTSACRMKMK